MDRSVQEGTEACLKSGITLPYTVWTWINLHSLLFSSNPVTSPGLTKYMSFVRYEISRQRKSQSGIGSTHMMNMSNNSSTKSSKSHISTFCTTSKFTSGPSSKTNPPSTKSTDSNDNDKDKDCSHGNFGDTCWACGGIVVYDDDLGSGLECTDCGVPN
ncbi:hypothetical protein P154DRAFT_570907 [Amniculicola lignicola CBS 123094]|uniref:Uncharacterized protein n=1 Tax=Amniculicola lignicola CBS 123094 TaxID=1392246 RepID=A0A6A5X1J2_9PLEO|nr:hypothetical protein P154DRAFT_570907 [Amniculicola lignicola CBS 123094]